MPQRQAREGNTADAYVNDNAQQNGVESKGGQNGDGPVRRPLIRAALPGTDGTPLQPTRQPPVFTMHQRTGRSVTDQSDLPDNFGNTWDATPAPQTAGKAGPKQGTKPRRRSRFRGGPNGNGNGNGQPNGNVSGNRDGRSHSRSRSRRNRGSSQ